MPTRNFFRDTLIGEANGLTIYELSDVQGSPTADVELRINNTAFVSTTAFARSGENITGTSFPVSVNVPVVDGALEVRFRIERADGALGDVLDSSDWSNVITTSGVSTQTLSLSTTWGAGDFLRITFQIRRSGGHGNVTADISTQDADSHVDAEFAAASDPDLDVSVTLVNSPQTISSSVEVGNDVNAELVNSAQTLISEAAVNNDVAVELVNSPQTIEASVGAEVANNVNVELVNSPQSIQSEVDVTTAISGEMVNSPQSVFSEMGVEQRVNVTLVNSSQTIQGEVGVAPSLQVNLTNSPQTISGEASVDISAQVELVNSPQTIQASIGAEVPNSVNVELVNTPQSLQAQAGVNVGVDASLVNAPQSIQANIGAEVANNVNVSLTNSPQVLSGEVEVEVGVNAELTNSPQSISGEAGVEIHVSGGLTNTPQSIQVTMDSGQGRSISAELQNSPQTINAEAGVETTVNGSLENSPQKIKAKIIAFVVQPAPQPEPAKPVFKTFTGMAKPRPSGLGGVSVGGVTRASVGGRIKADNTCGGITDLERQAIRGGDGELLTEEQKVLTTTDAADVYRRKGCGVGRPGATNLNRAQYSGVGVASQHSKNNANNRYGSITNLEKEAIQGGDGELLTDEEKILTTGENS